MGMIDNQLQFCSAAAMPSGATATSTNAIDLSVIGHFFNTERPMKMYMIWSGTPVGTSLRIDLRSGATPTDLTSSPVIHWSSGIIPQASYAAVGWGSGLVPALIDLPSGGFNPGIASTGGTYKQYLGLVFVAVGDATAGLLTAGLCAAGCYDQRNYPASGFTAPAAT